MNCPSHCLIFGSKRRSYRELPWRVADFGRLHRYERGGVVHGLARVRSFCQDDAHIFCTRGPGRAARSRSSSSLFYEVYKAFGFEKIDIKLATPARQAHRHRRAVGRGREARSPRRSNDAGLPFEVVAGRGRVLRAQVSSSTCTTRSSGRWQLGTIQLDSDLPERFDLEFIGADGKEHRPVMLHRAIFGSLERFFGVYLEHCGGSFPAWLAPEQAIVLTVSEKQRRLRRRSSTRLRAEGPPRRGRLLERQARREDPQRAALRATRTCSSWAPKEAESDTVGVRSRDAGELGAMPLDELAAPAAGRGHARPAAPS